MPQKDKACGFISGKKEIQKWSKTDLFQFFYDTKPLLGELKNIIKPPDIDSIKTSIKISSENLYHAAIHSFIHSDNLRQNLPNLYKMIFFILQAKYFVETNNYIPTKNQLTELLINEDREILEICIKRENIVKKDLNEIEKLYYKLIQWSSNNI